MHFRCMSTCQIVTPDLSLWPSRSMLEDSVSITVSITSCNSAAVFLHPFACNSLRAVSPELEEQLLEVWPQ